MRASRFAGVTAVAVLAMLLSGCSGLIDQVRRDVVGAGGSDDSGYTTSTGDTRVWDLRAGDCIDDPDGDVVEKVQTRNCSSGHDDEVVAIEKIAGDEFPGDLRVDKLGQVLCRDDLVSYGGRDFETSSLDYWYFVPTAKDWNAGHHQLICYAYDWSAEVLTSSVRGANL